MPKIRIIIAKRQLLFIGKIFRNSSNHLPTQLLTAWWPNKRKVGAPLHTNKKSIVNNLQLILPNMSKYAPLEEWGYYALDEKL